MKPMFLLPAACAFVVAASGAATAAPAIQRGEAGGRVSYGDAPCTSGTNGAVGTARRIAVDDPRPDADVRAAHAVAARERALAETLRDERLHAEAAIAQAGRRAATKQGPARAAPAVKATAASDLRTARSAPPPVSPRHRPAARGTSRAAGPPIRRAPG